MKRWIVALPAALLLLCAGCTPKTIETPPPAPSVLIPDDPAVKTDWSKLAPYEPDEGVYTRRYEGFTDTLIPADDYGPLVPYLGKKLGGLWAGNRYGLMTLTGEIVTDPVFAEVWRGGNQGGYLNNSPLPYLMLSKGSTSPAEDDWGEPGLWAMAAPDGSWCTGFKYQMDSELTTWGRAINGNATEDGLFVLDGQDMVYLDGATGKEQARIKDIPQLWDALFSAFRWDGKLYYQAEGFGREYTLLDLATGAKTVLSQREAERQSVSGDGKTLTYSDGEWKVLDIAGKVLLQAPVLTCRAWPGGNALLDTTQVEMVDGGGIYRVNAVYAADTLEAMETPLVGKAVEFIMVNASPAGKSGKYSEKNAGWIWFKEGENLFFVRGEEMRTLPALGRPSGIMAGDVVFLDGDDGALTLVTLSGEILGRTDNISWGYDWVTGQVYVRRIQGDLSEFFDGQGTRLGAITLQQGVTVGLADGMLLLSGPSNCTLQTFGGKQIFRDPLPTGEWD